MQHVGFLLQNEGRAVGLKRKYRVYRHAMQGMYLTDPFTDERARYSYGHAVRVAHAWRIPGMPRAAEIVPTDTNAQDGTFWVRLL